MGRCGLSCYWLLAGAIAGDASGFGLNSLERWSVTFKFWAGKVHGAILVQESVSIDVLGR